MLRSLNSAVAGLRAHQTQMDVIGNNIANVNTVGYKASRATFTDIYYQTISSGNVSSGSRGGVNMTQIGYGAQIATIDKIMAQGGMSATNRPYDIYVNGQGMIVVEDDQGGLYYTRAGNLTFDADGNLVDGNGNIVKGYPIDRETGMPVSNANGSVYMGDLASIKIPSEYINLTQNISISKSGEISGYVPGSLETIVNERNPDWIADVDVRDPSIRGNVHIQYYGYMPQVVDPSVWSAQASWVQNIQVMNNIVSAPGNFTFSLVMTIYGAIITALSPDGKKFTGLYKKNGTVDLKDDNGKTGFKITTNSEDIPQGNFGDIFDMGTKQLNFVPGIIATAYTASGDTLKETYYFDDPNTSEVALFTDKGPGVIIKLDPNNPIPTGVISKSAEVYPSNYPGWLTNVDAGNADLSSYANNAPIDAELSVGGTIGSPEYNITVYIDGVAVGTQTYKNLDALPNSVTFSNGIIFSLNPAQLRTTFEQIATPPPINFSESIATVVDGASPPRGDMPTHAELDALPWIDDVVWSQPDPFPYPSGKVELVLNIDDNGAYWVTAVVEESPGNWVDIGNSVMIDPDDLQSSIDLDAVLINLTSTGFDELVEEFDTMLDDGVDEISFGFGAILPASPGSLSLDTSNMPSWLSLCGGDAYIIPRPPMVPGLPIASGDTVDVTITGPDANGWYEVTASIGNFTNTPAKVKLYPTLETDNSHSFSPSMICPFGLCGTPIDLHINLLKMTDQIPYAADTHDKVGEVVFDYPEYRGNIVSVGRGEQERLVIGQLVLANFPNEEGLSQVGVSYYRQAVNSGEPIFAAPGLLGNGETLAGTLESSNVDIAQEFSDMIRTQRGFQANSRMITVSDSMLEELVNLKR